MNVKIMQREKDIHLMINIKKEILVEDVYQVIVYQLVVQKIQKWKYKSIL